MKKFLNLLRKEIKELVTLQLFISLLFTIGLFYFIGQMAKKEMKKAMMVQKICVLDLDRSPLSKSLLDNLRFMNFQIEFSNSAGQEEAIQSAKDGNANLLLVIPGGFGESVSKFEIQPIETYTFLRTFSISGTKNSAILGAVIKAVNNYISDDFLKKKFPDMNPGNLKNPIKSKDYVIVKNRMAEGSASSVTSFVYSQSIVVPIILMMIIIYSSQMVISAIAMEKQNKTLETLLTVPIGRTSIVTAKMLASGLVGLISAIIYMIGFKYYMGGLMSDVPVAANIGNVIHKLGLSLSTNGYILLGISLFAAILCALALATILGVLAEDYRSAQSLLMPVIFLVMIPYFISFFSDMNSLSVPLKVFILAIPFTHPFLATQNILLENYQSIFLGILYMLVFFAVLVFIAARIFSTDKVLTMKLRWRRKRLLF